MLHFIRERVQGIMAWVIVGLLIIPFALWGINEYFGNGGSAVVATVNDSEISQRQFQQAFFEQRTRMQQMLGAQYDGRLFDEQIRQATLDDLVNRELIRQYAEDNGFRVAETVVASTIRNLSAFQENGSFSNNLYEQQLRSQGQTPAMFEQRVGQAMLLSQLPEGLVNTAIVTKAEVDEAIRLQQQQRAIEYLMLPMGSYQDESRADEAAIKAYYEDNQPRFMAPEQVQVEYVELAASQLTSAKAPDEAMLREFFDARANEFRVPEERHVKHILIQAAEGADEATLAEARSKAADLLARIKAGENFEELAKTYSEDPGSAPSGGDLGFFARGAMVPAFEEAAFALQQGEVSEVVQTSFGFHILKLEAIRESQGKDFEDVRAELLNKYQKEQAEREYFALAEQLTNLAYETPDSLKDVAEQIGLELKESEFFSRSGGNGIFANPRVVDAAFSDEVMLQGYNSEPVEIDEHHVVVMRLLTHREASQQSLDEVKDQVKNLLIDELARDATIKAADQMLEKLQAGEAADALAQSVSSEWSSVQLGRESEDLEPAVVNEVFRLPRPGEQGVSYGKAVLPNGDVAVLVLKAVADGDPAVIDPAQRETLKRRLLGVYGSSAEQRLIEALKAKAEIRLNSDDI